MIGILAEARIVHNNRNERCCSSMPLLLDTPPEFASTLKNNGTGFDVLSTFSLHHHTGPTRLGSHYHYHCAECTAILHHFQSFCVFPAIFVGIFSPVLHYDHFVFFMAFYNVQLLFVVFPDLYGLPCNFLLLKGFFLALLQMSGAAGTAPYQVFQWKGQSFESNRDRLAAYALNRISHISARRPLVASIVEAILMGPVETISIRVARLLAKQHLIATNLQDLRIAGKHFVRNLVDSNGNAGCLRTILADIVKFDDKFEHAPEFSKPMFKVVINQLAAEYKDVERRLPHAPAFDIPSCADGSGSVE